MKNYIVATYAFCLLTFIYGCKKSEFLDKKPSTNLLTPTTLADFQGLLDNTVEMNQTGGLCLMSSDEIQVSDTDWPTGSSTERNSYIWAKDIYAGDTKISDWNELYQQVFYANSVLDGLQQSPNLNTAQGQYLKGWALFARAFAFYDLTRTFCKAYNASTAGSDLGIPLRLKSGIDQIEQRASLQSSYTQILNDLTEALPLLPDTRPTQYFNRPTKPAVYAFLARLYLDMRNYSQAEVNADLALKSYNTLIDYNTVDSTTDIPFSKTNAELIYYAVQVPDYGDFTPVGDFTDGKIPVQLLKSYQNGDLRPGIFFGDYGDGTFYRKGGYDGNDNYSFTGFATDELYLIKAECLARDGQTTQAMSEVNALLINRFKNTLYSPLNASTASEALTKILTERKKELVWRGLRWYDMKRLNAEGANISLTRIVEGQQYSLLPNDNRWVLPIPSDEIIQSGIAQNPR